MELETKLTSRDPLVAHSAPIRVEAHMRRQSKLYLLGLSFALGVTSNVLADGPTYTTIDFPGAATTLAWGINTRGDIVGGYLNADKSDHGFLLNGGQYSTIDFPGATGYRRPSNAASISLEVAALSTSRRYLKPALWLKYFGIT